MREAKYHTGGKRLGAAAVDGLVFAPFIMVNQWISASTQNLDVLIAWTVLAALAPVFYSIILHYKYGQTIGKWAFALKVLHISETRTLTLNESILRDIPYLLVEIFALGYLVFLAKKENFNDFPQFDDFTAAPLFIWNLLEVTTLLTNYKRRAIHDFIARSVVVRADASG